MPELSAEDLDSTIRGNLADALGCAAEDVAVSSIGYTPDTGPDGTWVRIFGEAYAEGAPETVRVFGYFVESLPS